MKKKKKDFLMAQVPAFEKRTYMVQRKAEPSTDDLEAQDDNLRRDVGGEEKDPSKGGASLGSFMSFFIKWIAGGRKKQKGS